MKIILISFLLVTSQFSFAKGTPRSNTQRPLPSPEVATDKCTDLSTSCFRDSKAYMSEDNGKKYCNNVATNCYNLLVLKHGFYGARDICLNIASNCFSDVSKHYSIPNALNSCKNVSNRCYVMMRASGESIKSSIQRCADVHVPCRTCF